MKVTKRKDSAVQSHLSWARIAVGHLLSVFCFDLGSGVNHQSDVEEERGNKRLGEHH